MKNQGLRKKVLEEFLLKKSDKIRSQKATKASEVATIKEVWGTQHDQVWAVKQSTTVAEIIATLYFAAEILHSAPTKT